MREYESGSSSRRLVNSRLKADDQQDAPRVMVRVALTADKNRARAILLRGGPMVDTILAMIIAFSAAATSYALLKEFSLRMILPPVIVGVIVVVGGAAYRGVHSPPQQ